MKYKLSKKVWEDVGTKAGWMKEAMAVPPPSPEATQEMAQQGLFILFEMVDKLPNVNKGQAASIIKDLQNADVGEFFKTLDPKNAIMLPAIYRADPKNLVEIEGHQYYVVSVTESRVAGRKQTVNSIPYVKGDQIPGQVICMDVETGSPVSFSYDDVLDSIKTPTENREVTLQKINDEIAAWNTRVKAIDNAVGTTKLALQVKWAEDKISERVAVLSAQEEALARKQVNPLEAFPSYANWVQSLRDGVREGRFNLRDVFDALLFLYQSDVETLIQGVENGSIQIPDELRQGILAIAAQELALKGEKTLKDRQRRREKEQRIEQELEEGKEPFEGELEPLSLEEIPETKYKTLTKNRTLDSWSSQIGVTIARVQEDRQQLEQIQQSLSGLRGYIGALEKGQRSTEYLRSPEGQEVVHALKEFLDIAQAFIKRYSVDVVQDGTINTKLMGRSGTVGNALLAVALNRIYVIIRKTLAEIETPVEVPVEASPKKDKITQMSETLWRSFKNKMRLR